MRRYHVTTFGCQMNAHDSERIRGTLEELGLGEAPSFEEADVLVFNTCTIREKPDQRLAAHLGNARAAKERNPETVVAVGGCTPRRNGIGCSSVIRLSTSHSARGRSTISAAGSAPAASASRGRPSGPAKRDASPRTSPGERPDRSRRGCRSRWAATPCAPTASCRPCAAARSAARRPRSSRRSTRSRRTASAR